MRSKWRRYSSSSASRSPCCARSTSARISGPRSVPLVPASAIPMDRAPPDAGRNALGARPGSEAEPRFAGEALEVVDPAQDDRVADVVGLDRERAVLARDERLLEVLGRLHGHEHVHHLPALEADLDPDVL